MTSSSGSRRLFPSARRSRSPDLRGSRTGPRMRPGPPVRFGLRGEQGPPPPCPHRPGARVPGRGRGSGRRRGPARRQPHAVRRAPGPDDDHDVGLAPTITTLVPTTTTTLPMTLQQPAPDSTLPPVGLADIVGQGATGPVVAAFEQRLANLHFDPGPVDGVYDQDTVYAVQTLQKIMGINPAGRIGRVRGRLRCATSSTPSRCTRPRNRTAPRSTSPTRS